MSQTSAFILTALLGYILGGANGAIIVSRFCYRQDVRELGSGNAGLTNFYRCFGKKWVAPVILTDLGKGMISVLLGRTLLSVWGQGDCGGAVGMLCCILGHMYPLFFGFRGGKGVLTCLGAFFVLDWRMAAVGLSVFLLVVAIWRYVSLGSVLAALLTPVVSRLLGHSLTVTALFAVCAALVVWRHRSNIGRLLRGEENKFALKKE